MTVRLTPNVAERTMLIIPRAHWRRMGEKCAIGLPIFDIDHRTVVCNGSDRNRVSMYFIPTS